MTKERRVKLTKKICQDRAGLYEEAAEHLEQCWDATTKNYTNVQFVTRHLRREIERWEIKANQLP
jgi:hypothetical protein